jgi:glutaredoxin
MMIKKTIFACVTGVAFAGGLAAIPESNAPAISPEVVAATIPDDKPAEIIPQATKKPAVMPDETAPVLSRWVDYSTAFARSGETGEPMVVVFGMKSCEPCKAVKKDLESEPEPGVIYCYIDIEQEPEVAQNFGYVPGKFAVPQVEVLAYHEGTLSRTWRYEGRPVKSVALGAVKVAARTGKRIASVLKKAISLPVKAVQAVRANQPVRGFLQRAPVRSFVGRCARCR